MDWRAFSYFSLVWLGQLVKGGVYFLLGYKEPVTVWNADGKPVDVLDFLPTDGQQRADLPVALGAGKQVQAPKATGRCPRR